jgi:precorrin-3B synthase
MVADTPITPAVRGWCPSAHAPMVTGDGWIVRVRVGCRPVSADQWAELADLAETFGNGLVEFTTRGNLQVRGIPEQLTGEAARRLVAIGLAGLDEADDRRRAVVVNPLARLAPSSCDAALAAAATPTEVTAWVERMLALHGGELPSKWWAVVDADTAWPMPVERCDLALQQHPGGWRMLLAGREHWSGLDPRPAASQVVARCAQRRCRVRDLEANPGQGADRDPDSTVDVLAMGSRSSASLRAQSASWCGLRMTGDWVAAAASAPFGVTAPATLRALASAAAMPQVSVHPTPQRGVLLVAPEGRTTDLAQCLDDLDRLGWITCDDDPRRLVSACIGSRGCAASLVDTWQVATDLIGSAERVHVSGCSKRCGVPAGVREFVASTAGVGTVASGTVALGNEGR